LKAPVVEFRDHELARLYRENPQRHFRPHKDNYPAIDFIMAVELPGGAGHGSAAAGGAGGGAKRIVHVPVQATVASTHDISVGDSIKTGLRFLATVFGWDGRERVPFVFAVPDLSLRKRAGQPAPWSSAQPIVQGGKADAAATAFFESRFTQALWAVPAALVTRAALQPLCADGSGDFGPEEDFNRRMHEAYGLPYVPPLVAVALPAKATAVAVAVAVAVLLSEALPVAVAATGTAMATARTMTATATAPLGARPATAWTTLTTRATATAPLAARPATAWTALAMEPATQAWMAAMGVRSRLSRMAGRGATKWLEQVVEELVV